MKSIQILLLLSSLCLISLKDSIAINFQNKSKDGEYVKGRIDKKRISCGKIVNGNIRQSTSQEGGYIHLSIDFSLSDFYPQSAKDIGISECSVITYIVVTKDGYLKNYCIQSNSCNFPDFDFAAIEILERVKYAPCAVNGKNETCYQKVPLRFTLTP